MIQIPNLFKLAWNLEQRHFLPLLLLSPFLLLFLSLFFLLLSLSLSICYSWFQCLLSVLFFPTYMSFLLVMPSILILIIQGGREFVRWNVLRTMCRATFFVPSVFCIWSLAKPNHFLFILSIHIWFYPSFLPFCIILSYFHSILLPILLLHECNSNLIRRKGLEEFFSNIWKVENERRTKRKKMKEKCRKRKVEMKEPWSIHSILV